MSEGIPSTLLRHFDVSAPYPRAEDISTRRPTYPQGQLFFDRLLALADTNTPSTDWASLYPPTSPSAQRKLLQAIHELPVDRLKRDCFIYYLLKDLDNNSALDMDVDGSRAASPSTPSSKAAQWARRRCIPRAWRTLMDGYWALDHGEWALAVEALTDPAIFDVNFLPDIVAALVTLVPAPQALELVHTLLSVRPPSSQDAADAALLAAANFGMLTAFTRIRAQAPGERARSREAVWCWALGAPRSPAGAGAHTAQPRALKELLHLVLSDEEHAHLVHFLAHPPRDIPAPARSLLHDLVTLRLIHAGKYEETLALDKELSESGADRQRRREMVREFIDILPAAQRRILLGDQGEKDWVVVEAEDSEPQQSQQEAPKALPAPAQEPAKPAESSTPAPIAAPTPVRPSLATRVLGTPQRPGSGFGGPPRFAESPRLAPPSTAASVVGGSAAPPSVSGSQRSASMRSPSPPASPPRRTSPTMVASPFHPPVTSRPAPAKKQPKRILDDEGPSRRSARASATPARSTPLRASRRSPSPTPTASEMDVDEHSGDETEKEGTPQPLLIEDEPEPLLIKDAPTPKLIEDGDEDMSDVEDEKPRLRRSTRRSEPPEERPSGRYNLRAPSEAPSEPAIPEDEALVPVPKPRSRRVVKPAAPPKRSTRASSRASTVEPDVPEEEEMPPPRIPGAFEPEPKKTTKAKSAKKATVTKTTKAKTSKAAAAKDADEKESKEDKEMASARRSAAKAALDDPEDKGATRGKARPKRTTRAQSVASSVADEDEEATPRRTRRTAASERGSPTPSVASSTASPTRRRTRAAAPTTRVTRSRK